MTKNPTTTKWLEYRERANQAGREFLLAIDKILPSLASRRMRSDKEGMVPHESVKDMEDAGVFRAMTPMQFGGLEMNPAMFFEGIMRIASADPSAAWIGGQLTVHCFEIALMSPEFQAEFWRDGPNTRASSAYAPVGKYEPTEGGYILNGKWVFSSGVDHAKWVVLGGGDKNFIVPASEIEIIPDSWDVQGLRGTGSKSLNVKDVFVPNYRVHQLMDIYHDNNPGWEINDRPFYRMSWIGLQNATMPNSAMGMTDGALNHFVEQTKVRLAKMGTGVPVSENPHMHVKLAAALTQVRGLKQRHLQNWQQLFDMACNEEKPSQVEMLRVRYESVEAAGKCFESITDLWPFAGANAIESSNPLPHIFRDLIAMRNHGSAARESAAAMYMKVLFGLPTPPVSNLNTLAYYK